jgi:hypothetical protein
MHSGSSLPCQQKPVSSSYSKPVKPNPRPHNEFNSILPPTKRLAITSRRVSPSFNHTHSLTELSPSSEAANCAATQELPSILWNTKVHYRVHKSPPMVPIQSQIDPIHTILFYLSKIHFNIVHLPTYW